MFCGCVGGFKHSNLFAAHTGIKITRWQVLCGRVQLRPIPSFAWSLA